MFGVRGRARRRYSMRIDDYIILLIVLGTSKLSATSIWYLVPLQLELGDRVLWWKW